MITFDRVSKRYGERLALDDVSWHMDEGECVAVVGPSGAGKTSFLRLITHETQPSSGTVSVGTFKGGRLRRRHRALLRRTLGIVYQDFRLLHDRSVFENVALAVRIAGRFDDEEVIPRVMYALDEAGLPLKHGRFPNELSYGERQRVAIARAVVNRPAVIVADEPTAALEKKSADEILATLRKIHEEGAALLLFTTREDAAQAVGGRILYLDDGKLVDASGQPLGALPTGRPGDGPGPGPAAPAAYDLESGRR
jgi:cell division transport system ATP-binding protein